MKLVLVRHGQTASNVSGALDTGRPGMPLTPRGQQQAQELAHRWENIAPAPDALGVSPLLRTRQTAQPLIERYGIEARILPGVREVRGGKLEMNASLVDLARYMKTMLPWIQGKWDARMPGGESGHHIFQRALPEVLTLLKDAYARGGEEATAVLVAHGAINRLIASALSPQIGENLVMMYRLDNCGTCVLESPEGWNPQRVEDLLDAFTAHTWNDKDLAEWDIPEELHIAVRYH